MGLWVWDDGLLNAHMASWTTSDLNTVMAPDAIESLPLSMERIGESITTGVMKGLEMEASSHAATALPIHMVSDDCFCSKTSTRRLVNGSRDTTVCLTYTLCDEWRWEDAWFQTSIISRLMYRFNWQKPNFMRLESKLKHQLKRSSKCSVKRPISRTLE